MRRSAKTSTPARFIAISLAVALVVGACAAGDPSQESGAADTAPSAETQSLLAPAEGKTEYPLTLTTPWGETVLEERPERIVALGTTDVELLAALGVTPVATQDTFERALWAQEALPGEIEEIYDWTGVDGGMPYEAIAASEPDLIVLSGWDLNDSFVQLAAIAPILSTEPGQLDSGSNWRNEIQAIGRALDLADAATTVTEEYDAFFEQARADNPEFEGLTVTLVVQYVEEYGTAYLTTPGSGEAQFFSDLGFAPNPLAEQFAGDPVVSSELVAQLDADVLIVAAANPDEDDVERLLTGTELFQQLGAVQSDRWAIFYSSADYSGYVFEGVEHPGNLNWAMAHGGAPLGKQWAAEQLIPILRSALDLD